LRKTDTLAALAVIGANTAKQMAAEMAYALVKVFIELLLRCSYLYLERHLANAALLPALGLFGRLGKQRGRRNSACIQAFYLLANLPMSGLAPLPSPCEPVTRFGPATDLCRLNSFIANS
jgi:hypothetical protein